MALDLNGTSQGLRIDNWAARIPRARWNLYLRGTGRGTLPEIAPFEPELAGRAGPRSTGRFRAPRQKPSW